MKIYLDGKQIEELCEGQVWGPAIGPPEFLTEKIVHFGTLTVGDTETPVWMYRGIEDDGEGGTIPVVYCHTMPPTAV